MPAALSATVNLLCFFSILLILLPFNHAADKVGYGEDCFPGTIECYAEFYLECNKEQICECIQYYLPSDFPSRNTTPCLAPVGFECFVGPSTVFSSCANQLATCIGDPPKCHCPSGYLISGPKCLAPLGENCLLSDGCMDEHAICVELNTTTTLASNLVDQLYDPYNVVPNGGPDELYICECDDGYELNDQETKCILSASNAVLGSCSLAAMGVIFGKFMQYFLYESESHS